jgi:hypothetical protein
MAFFKDKAAFPSHVYKRINGWSTCSKWSYTYFIPYTKSIILALMATLFFHACSNPINKDSNSKLTSKEVYFTTRGVVLTTEDLSTVDWAKKAKEAGLTTLATHITPSQVVQFIQSPKGQAFVKQCKKLGLELEHELHAMKDLLPRELFKEDSTMFRMNTEGRRVADYNLCVHSQKALDIVSKNAVKYAKILTPTTGRYFYWIDDGRPMCYCSQCIKYSESEQALILENKILQALREFDPRATLAHLAYLNTMSAPVKVKPLKGIFLEFAPIQRSWNFPVSKEEVKLEKGNDSTTLTHGDILKHLDENLKVFGTENAQVLEYWLDVSLFSKWKKPAVKLPWNKEVFQQDIATYAKRGIKHITTFAVYIDEEYIRIYKDLSFINEYGEGLQSYQP